MKIYTKTGDNGTTSLIGGVRVSKSNPQIEAYGSIDELISVIGMLKNFDIPEEFLNDLLTFQNKLFQISSAFASPIGQKNSSTKDLNLEDIDNLEKRIDELQTEIAPLTKFIIPEGSFLVSYCHIARTVCRRVERIAVSVEDFHKQFGNSLAFINRLSDYFFIIARVFAKRNNLTENFFDNK